MPTETFYNLPGEKRERLVAAIRRELTRAPFDEMSINRIVKDACIPRGSYYQYFRDKQDLYDFVLEDFRALLLRSVEQTLERNRGDLFQALLVGFDTITTFAKTQESATLFANLFTGFGDTCRAMPKRMTDETVQSLCSKIDRRRLRTDKDEPLRQLVEMSLLLLIHSLIELFGNVKQAPSLREQLCIRLDFIQNGAGNPLSFQPEGIPHAS